MHPSSATIIFAVVMISPRPRQRHLAMASGVGKICKSSYLAGSSQFGQLPADLSVQLSVCLSACTASNMPGACLSAA